MYVFIIESGPVTLTWRGGGGGGVWEAASRLGWWSCLLSGHSGGLVLRVGVPLALTEDSAFLTNHMFINIMIYIFYTRVCSGLERWWSLPFLLCPSAHQSVEPAQVDSNRAGGSGSNSAFGGSFAVSPV